MPRDPRGPDLTLKPTRETYDALQLAYEHFNWALFDRALPNCLITLQRRGRGAGYFAPDRLRRADGAACDEISLNPSRFRALGDRDVLAVLVHEMVHLWQRHFGRPGRGGYHNAEWAAKMRRLGLPPSHTGAPGGRETGDAMSHHVLPNGPFARAAQDLLGRGFSLPWADGPAAPRAGAKPGARGGRRRKFVCPVCGLAAWSRPEAALRCGHHDAAMLPRD